MQSGVFRAKSLPTLAACSTLLTHLHIFADFLAHTEFNWPHYEPTSGRLYLERSADCNITGELADYQRVWSKIVPRFSRARDSLSARFQRLDNRIGVAAVCRPISKKRSLRNPFNMEKLSIPKRASRRKKFANLAVEFHLIDCSFAGTFSIAGRAQNIIARTENESGASGRF